MKDEIIDKLWESSNHGTERKDIVAAQYLSLVMDILKRGKANERDNEDKLKKPCFE